MSQPSPEKLFADVEKFVADNRTMLRKGEILDLEGLDEEVVRLCKAVLLLSQEDRLKHADMLQKLLNDLGELGNEMRQERDAVATQIQQLSQHRQAHVAYQKADAVDDPKKKKAPK